MVISDRRHKQCNYRPALITSWLIRRLSWLHFSGLLWPHHWYLSVHLLFLRIKQWNDRNCQEKLSCSEKYLQNANIFADPLNYLLSGFQRPICGSLSGAVKICPPRIRRFLKGKFILSGLCAVRGAGCEPVGNLFNNRQTHNCTRVDHWPVWPQTGVSLSLEAPFSLTRQKCMNLNLKRPPELTITRLGCKHFIPTLPSLLQYMANISVGRISILFATDVQHL